ncbi:MAG: serine hydrolase domain-containing protein [Luteimonas sp.]
MQERGFPVQQRITVKVEDTASRRLDYIMQASLQIPQSKALEAFDAFATQLAAADRFSGVLVIEHGTGSGSLISSTRAILAAEVTGKEEVLMRISLRIVALLLCLATPALAMPPAETAFDEWLDAFNRNDRASLAEFNTRRFGEPEHNIEYLLDSREETGGLDVVVVERSEPLEFVALTQERSFPVQRRITLQVEDAASGHLEHITQAPLQIPQKRALEAFDAFATQLAAADRFSGVLVVEQNGQRLYAKPFGLANREDDTPVQLDTPFLFASQGKMFTAVAVLQLVAAGKLGLDDPLGKHLSDYPHNGVRFTSPTSPTSPSELSH